MPNPAMLSRVESLMLADDAFASEFEKFAKDNCSVFEDTEENKLQSTRTATCATLELDTGTADSQSLTPQLCLVV